MNRFNRLHLYISIPLIFLALFFLVIAFSRLPLVVVVARNSSSLVQSFSVDQGYYRERFSKNENSVKTPPVLFFTFVDERQKNPLNITIGGLNLDGLLTSSYDVLPFGLAASVRLHIDPQIYEKYKEHDLSYLASLTFEQTVKSAIVGQQKIDYLTGKSLYEDVGRSISDYYRVKSYYPVKMETLK